MAADKYCAVTTGLSALLIACSLGAALAWAGGPTGHRAPIVDRSTR
jgi:hypothetical protein